MVRHHLAAPHDRDNVQARVEPFSPGPRVPLLSERKERIGQVYKPDAYDNSPPGQVIEGNHLPSHLPRAPAGKGRDHDVYPYATGVCSNRDQRNCCVADGVVALEVVASEIAVPAGVLDLFDKLC